MAIENSAQLIFTRSEEGLVPTEQWGVVFNDFRQEGIENAGLFLGTLVIGELGFADTSKIKAYKIADAFSANIQPPLDHEELEQLRTGIVRAEVAWINARLARR